MMVDKFPVQLLVTGHESLDGSGAVEISAIAHDGGAAAGFSVHREGIGEEPGGDRSLSSTGTAAIDLVAKFVAEHAESASLVVKHWPGTESGDVVVYPAGAWPPIRVRLAPPAVPDPDAAE